MTVTTSGNGGNPSTNEINQLYVWLLCTYSNYESISDEKLIERQTYLENIDISTPIFSSHIFDENT